MSRLVQWAFGGGEGGRSVLADVRSGRAGWPVRIGISLAAAAALASGAMFALGSVDHVSPIRDEHIAVAIGVAGATWCVALALIWHTYRRWTRTLRTMFAILVVWAIVIPACVLIDAATSDADFLIAGCIFAGSAVTILHIATAAFRARGGRALHDREGRVRVSCPECGYSLVGLESCQCPECGMRTTLDALIARQDYAVLRLPAGEGDAQSPPAEPPIVEVVNDVAALPSPDA
jgi:hypothetical protein